MSTPSDSSLHLVNPQLMKMAYQSYTEKLSGYAKTAFVAAGDPSMDPAAAMQQQQAGGGGGGGGGGSPLPGGDPSGGGGGGAPPPAPSGGGADPAVIAQMVTQQLQGGGMGGGAAGGMGGGMVEPIKPKIDVNVELMQIKKMLARIADMLGVHIPAAEMAVNSQDLTQMAMQQGGQQAGGGQQQSSISPIAPIQGASPQMAAAGGGAGAGAGAGGGMGKVGAFNNGEGMDTAGLDSLQSRASAISRLRATPVSHR